MNDVRTSIYFFTLTATFLHLPHRLHPSRPCECTSLHPSLGMVSLILPTASMPCTPPPSRPKTLKRDSTHLQLASDDSPTKRNRVAFSDDVDVRILEGWNSRPQELVLEEVRLAIDSHLRRGNMHDDSAYEQLRMTFAAAALDDGEGEHRPDGFELSRPNSALLKQYLAALLRRVGDLKGCTTLLYAILDLNWLGRRDDFVNLYIKFLGTLASAHPGFLRHILEKTVRHYVSRECNLSVYTGSAS